MVGFDKYLKMFIVIFFSLFIISCSDNLLPDSETQTIGKISNGRLLMPKPYYTTIPPYGSGAYVYGQVDDCPYGVYKICMFIRVPNASWTTWWVKPTWASPFRGISTTGSWSCDYVTGGIDSQASSFIAYVVPITMSSYGSAHSGYVTYCVTNRLDTGYPTVTITDPVSNAVVYQSPYPLTGTYSDNYELDGVFISINGADYVRVPDTLRRNTGPYTWVYKANLLEGKNSIKVYTQDWANHQSTVKSSTFIYRPLKILNIKDEGALHSGMIVGTASNDNTFDRVEVKIDGQEFVTVEGTDNWIYRLPKGTDSWKIGSKHTISVRGHIRNGRYTSILTRTFYKGVNKDINGDGYSDLVAGSPGKNSNNGYVYIFNGTSSGITAANPSGADTAISGNSQGFGNSIDVADINKDGFADIVIGDNTLNNDKGCVYVFHGSSTGIDSRSAASANTIINGVNNSGFGVSVAVGDITGSGYLDLVVGADKYSNDKGGVYFFFGGSSGFNYTSASSANAVLTGDGSSGFGNKVSLGDIDGDGHSDLVTCDKNYNNNQGRLSIFRGCAFGLNSIAVTYADKIILGEASSGLGSSLTIRDINNDGYADIGVGANNYNAGQGMVYVFKGSLSVINAANCSQADIIIEGESASGFGSSVVFGNINGDEFKDLIVGSDKYNSSQGRVYIFQNSSSGISSGSSASIADAILTGVGSNGFGLSLSTSDVDMDGISDLLIGQGNDSVTQGWVYYFKGLETGISTGTSSSADRTITGDASYNFGSVIK